MKRLSRYLAAWAMSRHHLAQDITKIADDRDRCMAEAHTAMATAERALGAARRFQTALAAEKAKSASLAADFDDLVGVDGIAW